MNLLTNIFTRIINSTTFLTIVSGVAVFIIGQIIIYIINNRNKYKSLKEEIGYILAYYKCYYYNPFNRLNGDFDNSKHLEAENEIRKIGAKLSGYIGTIPFFRFGKKKKLHIVVENIIGISNGLFVNSKDYNPVSDTKKMEEKIRKLLKLEL